jgi:hypothetical protein
MKNVVNGLGTDQWGFRDIAAWSRPFGMALVSIINGYLRNSETDVPPERVCLWSVTECSPMYDNPDSQLFFFNYLKSQMMDSMGVKLCFSIYYCQFDIKIKKIDEIFGIWQPGVGLLSRPFGLTDVPPERGSSLDDGNQKRFRIAQYNNSTTTKFFLGCLPQRGGISSAQYNNY